MIVLQDADRNRVLINPALVAKAHEFTPHKRIDVWLLDQTAPISIVFATPKLTVSAFDTIVQHYFGEP